MAGGLTRPRLDSAAAKPPTRTRLYTPLRTNRSVHSAVQTLLRVRTLLPYARTLASLAQRARGAPAHCGPSSTLEGIAAACCMRKTSRLRATLSCAQVGALALRGRAANPLN